MLTPRPWQRGSRSGPGPCCSWGRPCSSWPCPGQSSGGRNCKSAVDPFQLRHFCSLRSVEIRQVCGTSLVAPLHGCVFVDATVPLVWRIQRGAKRNAMKGPPEKQTHPYTQFRTGWLIFCGLEHPQSSYSTTCRYMGCDIYTHNAISFVACLWKIKNYGLFRLVTLKQGMVQRPILGDYFLLEERVPVHPVPMRGDPSNFQKPYRVPLRKAPNPNRRPQGFSV